MQIKSKKLAQGRYEITVHEIRFVLEKLYGDRNWTLYNSSKTEVNRFETKSGALETLRGWSFDYTLRMETAEFCDYA
jgi:hypothetical protein